MAEKRLTSADYRGIAEAIEEGDPAARLERKRRELGEGIRDRVIARKRAGLERLGPPPERKTGPAVGDTYIDAQGVKSKISSFDDDGTAVTLENGTRVLTADLTRRG